MTDQFKNLKDEDAEEGVISFAKAVKESDIEKIIAELEALTAASFKDGNLIAHYTFNTAIGIVKKYVK